MLADKPFVSVTVSVMTVEPLVFGLGVTVRLRLLPEPEKRKPLFGTMLVSADVPVTVRAAGGICASPMTKAIGRLVALG